MTNTININRIFYIFIIVHLLIWTLVPSLTNKNLPLDTLEALSWGSDLDWGFNKHPPASAFFSEIFFQIFGSQDWAYYFLSQIFVAISFIVIFKFANEIFEDKLLAFFSVLILEGIFYYNFTTPEFNVNISQLPFWSLTIYYSWKIYNSEFAKFKNFFLLGIFASIGVLSKYLFFYLLISLFILFLYAFIKYKKKLRFEYFFTLEVFCVLLLPHILWLFSNDFITINYALNRASINEVELIDHIKLPLIFIIKQIVLLIPFLFLLWLLVKTPRIKINTNDKKFVFLFFINVLPIFLIIVTSLITGSKIRTMWMTPFYLFFGVFMIYLFQKQIILKISKLFLFSFLFLFLLSPILYGFISIYKEDKRTDYPGKAYANIIQNYWDKGLRFDLKQKKIIESDLQIKKIITENEWLAWNLSYHLKSRPIYVGPFHKKFIKYENTKEYLCIDEKIYNHKLDLCVGSN